MPILSSSDYGLVTVFFLRANVCALVPGVATSAMVSEEETVCSLPWLSPHTGNSIV